MISPALSLDAILAAIACLCSTTEVSKNQVSAMNNFNNLSIPNSSFWKQSEQLNDIQERLTKLEYKIDRIYELVQAQFGKPNVPPKNCFTLQIAPEVERVIVYAKSASMEYFGVCKNIPQYGNWILIQRRRNGKENFFRNWQDYRDGFGSLQGDFFIGLERLYQLTNNKYNKYQLLIRMKRKNDDVFQLAHYDRFEIDSEDNGYALKKLGTYNGTAGDSLSSHLGAAFTTFDQDNDNDFFKNCAITFHGAWWFTSCFKSHLNGKYFRNSIPDKIAEGIIWSDLTGYNSSLISVEMLIKIANV